MKKNNGFTLIETMVSVVILGVLTTLSVSAYQDYTIKSQVTEGLNFAGGAKVNVVEYYSNNSKMPRSEIEAGINSPNNVSNIYSMYVDKGVIITMFNGNKNKKLRNKILFLTPTITEKNNIVWDCKSTIPSKHLPSNCESLPEDIGESKVMNPNGGFYTLNQRLGWLNGYYDAYNNGPRILTDNVYDQNGKKILAKGADSLEQTLANAYLIKLFMDGLKQDGYPDSLLPEIPKVTLKSEADAQEAQEILNRYFGQYYDGSVFWEQ